MEKYGFVYLWYDRKRKMYYVGSHWGTETDGYICSSNRMRDAYRRRPDDFKRRIIYKVENRLSLLDEEHKWLLLIQKNELGKKYYNLRNTKFGHWVNDANNKKDILEKMRQANIGKKRTEETKRKISEANKGKKKSPFSEEHKENISKSAKGRKPSQETIDKRRVKMIGENNPNFGKTFSEEHRLKLSVARRKRIISEETKRKISESSKKRIYKKGYKLSEEHKLKISQGMKNIEKV